MYQLFASLMPYCAIRSRYTFGALKEKTLIIGDKISLAIKSVHEELHFGINIFLYLHNLKQKK